MNRTSVRSILVITTLLIGVVAAGMICTACAPPSDPVQRAVDEIPTDTSRSDALRILADAECHLECWYNDNEVVDLFFYRSCNPEEAQVVIVGSRIVSDELRVYQVGTYEYYALRQAFDWCLGSGLSGKTSP